METIQVMEPSPTIQMAKGGGSSGLTAYTNWAIGIAVVVILVAYVIVPAMGFFFNQTIGNALKNAPTYVVTLLNVAIGIGVAVAILVFLFTHIGKR
jgi:hypothetical protein